MNSYSVSQRNPSLIVVALTISVTAAWTTSYPKVKLCVPHTSCDAKQCTVDMEFKIGENESLQFTGRSKDW